MIERHIENVVNSQELIDSLGIPEETIKKLLWEFEERFKTPYSSIEKLIHDIRKFYREDKLLILNIFQGTRLSNSDCLSRCIIWYIICEKMWYSVDIARPNSLGHYFHHFLIDKNWKKFKLSWESPIRSYTTLSPNDVLRRLQIIHPIISLWNYIKNRIHTTTETWASPEELPDEPRES